MTLHNTHSHSKVGGCPSKEKGHHTKKGSASRGTLSPRQKQDVLFAVRLVKNEGIEAMVHGIILRPLESSAMSLPTKQDGRKAHAASTQPLEPSGSSVPPPSKKLQRSNTRLREFQGKFVAAKWLRVTRKLVQMAAHCAGWAVKSVFLANGLKIREKSLEFMRRVISHHSKSRKRSEPPTTPPPSARNGSRIAMTPSTPKLMSCIPQTRYPFISPRDLGKSVDEDMGVEKDMLLLPTIAQSMEIPRPTSSRARVAKSNKKPRGGRAKR